MSDTVYRRTHCRLCDSPRLELALDLGATPLADAYVDEAHRYLEQQSYPLALYRCTGCSFVQLLEIVIPKVIYLDYIYETVSSLGLVNHFEGYAADVVKALKPMPQSLVVDIGSNDGTLLKHFKAHSLRVQGVDPAVEIARRATAAGVDTIADFFGPALGARIRADKGPATIITANNLYANVDELRPLTEAIRDLLADDGVFVFESFYLADWMKNLVFDFAYHEHLSYFSVAPMKRFFASLGMELLDVVRIPTKGGSMRCMVQKAGGPRQVTSAVEKFIAEEEASGINSMSAFNNFSARILDAKKAVVDQIKMLKAQGKRIAGYGASATSTTLLYHFELNEYLDFIVDDYPAKQSLFTPGYHIPVFSSEALYSKKPDYVLAIAWRYVDPIVQKHQAYLAQGGKFIVPLPEFRIIEDHS